MKKKITMSFKTENQIFSDIIGVINGFLEACGQTGWSAIQGAQAIPLGMFDKVILLYHVYVVKVGWQGHDNKYIESSEEAEPGLFHYEKWREERSIQLSFLNRRRPGTDTVSTWSASDMARQLLAYLDGAVGTGVLQELGYGKLRSENIRIGNFMNDSDRYQLSPTFDLIILYDQEITTSQNGTTIIDAGIYPI